MPQGNVSGNVSGNSVNLTIQSGAESVTFSATVDSSAKTLVGTWNYATSASTDCAGDTGNFSGTQTGDADITW